MKKHLFVFTYLLVILGFMNCKSQKPNELESGFIDVDGGRIYYEVKGQGEPLILLHPGLTDLRMWKQQVNELSKNFRVICYDQRGYGKSDLPSKKYAPNSDLLTLMDSLKIEKADIVGICMGALHAMEFTIEYPEKVNSLALSGISFLNWKYPDNVIKKHIEFSSIAAEGPEKAIETIIKDPFWKQTIPSDNFKTAQETFLELLEDNKKAFTANWQYKEQKFNTMDRISEINIPVLVIRPEKEVDYMIEIGDYLVENLRKVEQIQIKGAGHLSNMEEPQIFNKIIVDFFNHYKNQNIKMNRIHAQSSEVKLDQIELMKQFLGTWKGELGNNTIFMSENKQFGNGSISNSVITTDGKVVDSVAQIYGYDNKTEKFIIAELKESSPVIELCSIWFTSENTGEIIIINPENAPLKFKFEFMSPNMIEQTAIQDNKVVNKIVLKRVEENK